MVKELWKLSAFDINKKYKNKETSPVEVTKAIVDRMNQVNDKINAYVYFDIKEIMKSANKATERWYKKENLSSLDGVPISIKDLILVKGMPTLRGSNSTNAKDISLIDAPVVDSLRRAGAIILGKTSTPEFGHKGTTQSLRNGITFNPWDLSVNSGGSSGGSAAAVASGMGPVSIGTDGGGSVRIPASFSGLFALKPTFGRIPAFPISPFGTIANIGPISRTVKDAAMLMNVISKPNIKDWYSIPSNCSDYLENLSSENKNLRIAYSDDWGMSNYLGYNEVDKDVIKTVEKTVKDLIDKGFEVEKININWPDDPAKMFKIMWLSGAANLFRKLSIEQKKSLDPIFNKFSEEGHNFSIFDLMSVEENRAENSFYFSDSILKNFSCVIGPTMPTQAFQADKNTPNGWPEDDLFSWTPFTFPFNLTKHPAASVNCGFSSSGLPVGMQIVAPLYKDEIC